MGFLEQSNKSMEESNIIKEVFDKMVKEYQRFLRLYYPAHGSNGFTERNLTFNFCHQYLNYHKNQNTKDIIVWQEIPTANPECSKRNNHFDSLIIAKNKIENNGSIFYIESKRIRNTSRHNSLKADLTKIQNSYKFIPDYESFQTYDKFAILLADIWILNENEDNRSRIKRQIEMEQSYLFEEIYKGENETYHINYELHSLK